MANSGKAWVLTGSLDNFRVCVERGFYLIGIQAFGGLARVTSEMFEDREPVWPGTKDGKLPKGGPDPYPWRVEAEPVLVLAEEDFVPAEELVDELEHTAKWPREHWHLAFQGQL